MSMFKKPRHEITGLNTASLPDLIFTVLFFFMIVTHIRPVAIKVKYQLPHGKELTRLTKKTAVSYIYIGAPARSSKEHAGGREVIQLNDKFATPDDIQNYIATEKSKMSPADLIQMTVAIQADEHTKLGLLNDVKLALRKANALKVSYSGTKE